MKIAFEQPRIEDFGSIAEHTFTRCGGDIPPHPPKDRPNVPHHIDKFGECSGLNGGMS